MATRRRTRTETAARHDFVRACAFIGILISAILVVVGAILRWCGLGSIYNILDLIAKLTLLVAVAIPAWDYVKYRTTGWRVVYWIALIIYIFGVVFGIIHVYIKK